MSVIPRFEAVWVVGNTGGRGLGGWFSVVLVPVRVIFDASDAQFFSVSGLVREVAHFSLWRS